MLAVASLHTRTSRLCRPSRRSTIVTCCKSTPKPLVVVGSINADLVLRVPRLPTQGETLAAEDLQNFPGGKGGNQAATGAKLGYPTLMIGQVGTDSNGDFMLEKLKEAGVDCSRMKRLDGPTGTAIVMLEPKGDNTIIIAGGANTAEWDFDSKQKDAMSKAGMVLLQREIPQHVNSQVAEICNAAGVPVILDAGGAEEELPEGFLKNLSVLSPNETELARLTNMPTDSTEEVLEAAQKLLEMGPAKVLVKRGGRGSMLLQDAEDGGGVKRIDQDAITPNNIVDTTGAGDCFTAAYAVAVLRGHKDVDAMLYAAAAASVCIQRMGAMSSLPHNDEVAQLL